MKRVHTSAAAFMAEFLDPRHVQWTGESIYKLLKTQRAWTCALPSLPPLEESLRALWIGQRVEYEDKALSSVPMEENESVRYSLQLSAPLLTSNHGTVARYNPAPIRSSWGGSFTAFRHRSQQLKDCLEHENTMSRFKIRTNNEEFPKQLVTVSHSLNRRIHVPPSTGASRGLEEAGAEAGYQRLFWRKGWGKSVHTEKSVQRRAHKSSPSNTHAYHMYRLGLGGSMQ